MPMPNKMTMMTDSGSSNKSNSKVNNVKTKVTTTPKKEQVQQRKVEQQTPTTVKTTPKASYGSSGSSNSSYNSGPSAYTDSGSNQKIQSAKGSAASNTSWTPPSPPKGYGSKLPPEPVDMSIGRGPAYKTKWTPSSTNKKNTTTEFSKPDVTPPPKMPSAYVSTEAINANAARLEKLKLKTSEDNKKSTGTANKDSFKEKQIEKVTPKVDVNKLPEKSYSNGTSSQSSANGSAGDFKQNYGGYSKEEQAEIEKLKKERDAKIAAQRQLQEQANTDEAARIASFLMGASSQAAKVAGNSEKVISPIPQSNSYITRDGDSFTFKGAGLDFTVDNASDIYKYAKDNGKSWKNNDEFANLALEYANQKFDVTTSNGKTILNNLAGTMYVEVDSDKLQDYYDQYLQGIKDQYLSDLIAEYPDASIDRLKYLIDQDVKDKIPSEITNLSEDSLMGLIMGYKQSNPEKSVYLKDGKYQVTDENGFIISKIDQKDFSKYAQTQESGLDRLGQRRVINGNVTADDLLNSEEGYNNYKNELLLEKNLLAALGSKASSISELKNSIYDIDNQIKKLDSEGTRKSVDKKIEKLQEEKNQLQEIYNTVVLNPQTRVKDFLKGATSDFAKVAGVKEKITEYSNLDKIKFNTDSLNVLDKIKGEWDGVSGTNLRILNALNNSESVFDIGRQSNQDYNLATQYVADKNDLTAILSCMINNKGNLIYGSNGVSMAVNGFELNLQSEDSMLSRYQSYLPYIKTEEKQMFNYIYTTKGADKAYDYLKNLSTELDNRWYEARKKEDSEFATAHPVIASAASLILPISEGKTAFENSIKSVLKKENISRTEVYSIGDVYRSTVSENIASDPNGGKFKSFLYNTGMSIADSGINTAATIVSGGVVPGFLVSAATMGSRVYVSSLNDALDKGISDSKAVGLSIVKSGIESAMESYSVGHLLGLEGKLGSTATKITSKISNSIKNETRANLATKGFYILANMLNQGIAEGEEEASTEILDYIADMFISKDKSDFEISMDNYTYAGYSESEAFGKTMLDLAANSAQAFAGGFASGIFYGGVSGVKSTAVTNYGVKNGVYGELSGNSAQQFAQAININQQQLADLETAQKNYKNYELAIDKLNTYQDALKAQQAGQKLTLSQKSILKSNATDLTSDVIKTGSLLTPDQMVLLSKGTSEMQAASDIKSKAIDIIKGNFKQQQASNLSETVNHNVSEGAVAGDNIGVQLHRVNTEDRSELNQHQTSNLNSNNQPVTLQVNDNGTMDLVTDNEAITTKQAEQSKVDGIVKLETDSQSNIDQKDTNQLNSMEVEESITNFITYLENDKEEVKVALGKTEEELAHFNDLKEKIIKYGSAEQIINNLSELTIWEFKKLISKESPLFNQLISNQEVLKYVTKIMSKEDILFKYAGLIPSNTLIIETLLSLTSQELDSIYIPNFLSSFAKIPRDVQKEFLSKHTEFFKKNISRIFSSSINFNLFFTIFDEIGSFEILKESWYEIGFLSDDIAIELLNRFKNQIYFGNLSDFVHFAERIKNPEYQADFIKNSPFFEELPTSKTFSSLFKELKSKDFVLELMSNKNFYDAIISDADCFKALMEQLTENEQQAYKSIIKNVILQLDLRDFETQYKIQKYIAGFSDNIRLELLLDRDILSLFTFDTMIKLNKENNGVYNDIFKKALTQNIDSDTAKFILDPELYKLMDQNTINKAASVLPISSYKDFIKFGNLEALNIILDKLIENKYSGINGFDLMRLYETLDPFGKQKIESSISIEGLLDMLNAAKFNNENKTFEVLVDVLINKIKTQGFSKKEYELKAISELNLSEYEKVIKVLEDDDKFLAFNYSNVHSLGLDNEFIEIFRNKPELINDMHGTCQSLYFFKILSDESDIESYYNNISIKTLLSLAIHDEFSILDKEKVKKIIKENIESYQFSKYSFQFLLKYYDFEEQIDILNQIDKSDRYDMLFKGYIKNSETKFEILKMLISDTDYIERGEGASSGSSFFDNLEKEYIDYILNNASEQFLGLLLTFSNRNDLNSRFSDFIKNNTLILTEFNYTNAELIYGNLSEQNRSLIDTQINDIISGYNNSEITNLLQDATTVQKSLFIDAYNKGLINDEKLDFLLNLKNKNRFVLSTFNYSLFDETIYKFGSDMITKLSKYYDVVDQMVELKKTPQKFNLFANFIINDSTSLSSIVSDQKMFLLLNYLLKNDINLNLLNIKNVNELEILRNIVLKQIDQLSILDEMGNEEIRDRSIIVPDDFTLENYYDKLDEKCDSLMKSAQSVEDVQNLFLNKYFSICIEDAKEIFRIYGRRFDSIKELDTDGVATTYLQNISRILGMTTMEEAKNFYSYFESRYDMNDMMNIINEIKKVYTRSLKSTLFNPTEITGYIEYNGKQIPIYQPTGDFQMLIQSTHTNYGGMPIINNNYFDSWNLSSRTENHGICCSLISNNNMGMAKVSGPGIVIGFYDFSDEQMNMMAPYDIYTRNDGYVIKCQRPFQFLPGKDVMNETRHTHNEFNLERTNLTGEGNLANIQPGYVIIFEEMSDQLKENACKASLDFNIPLVYISKETLAQQESKKIDNLISEYKITGNLELLRQILVLHENNRSGYRNPTDENLMKKYFLPDRIVAILKEAIENNNSNDGLQYIKDILSDEVSKFDTTLEMTSRVNQIDIDCDSLIKEIENKQSQLQDIKKENIEIPLSSSYSILSNFKESNIQYLKSDYRYLSDDLKNSQKTVDDIVSLLKEGNYIDTLLDIEDEIYQEKINDGMKAHGVRHILDVVLFSTIVGSEILDSNDLKLLLLAAKYHDVGRTLDNGEEHAYLSSIIARERLLNKMTPEELSIVTTAIEFHEVPRKTEMEDSIFDTIATKNGVIDDQKERARVISEILKDADALDRTRFVNRARLNSNFLKYDNSKKLIKFSSNLQELYAIMDLENYEYDRDLLKSNTPQELLRQIRKNGNSN